MLILNLTQKIKLKSIFIYLSSSILTYRHHRVAQPSTISLSLNGSNLSFPSPCSYPQSKINLYNPQLNKPQIQKYSIK